MESTRREVLASCRRAAFSDRTIRGIACRQILGGSPAPSGYLGRKSNRKSGRSTTRHIGAAYYALFHFSLAAAPDLVLSPSARSSAEYALVYRSVDHKGLRALCTNVSTQPKNLSVVPSGGFGQIADFAGIVASLYERRNLADYDPSQTYTAIEVKLLISDAREAIKWFQASTPLQQRAFLVNLLFKSR